MKKTLSLVLTITFLLLSLTLSGCKGKGGELEFCSFEMIDDSTVSVTFRNESGKDITHVEGTLNLFTGSTKKRSPDKTADFEWNGSCADGMIFTVTADIYGAPIGFADEVNRVGHRVYEIK